MAEENTAETSTEREKTEKKSSRLSSLTRRSSRTKSDSTSGSSASVPGKTSSKKAKSRKSQSSSKSKKVAKVEKTWAEKLDEKSAAIDSYFSASRTFGGRLTDSMVEQIKARIRKRGPTGIHRIHFLGQVRQRKMLAREIQRILDA